MMKNASYFTLKTLFVLKIFKFLYDFLVMLKQQLNYKDKVNFKIHDVTNWLKNNCNTHVARFLKK